MTIYIPASVVWYILGFISPFVLAILWAVATGISKKLWDRDENSPHK